MSKITNSELLVLSRSIQALVSSDQKMPIKVWYAINKNSKTITEHAKNYDEARKQLVDQFAEKHEKDSTKKGDDFKKGDPIEKDGEYVIKEKEKFDEEFKNLLEEKVKIDLHKVKVEDCGDLEISGQQNPFMGSFVEHCIVME